jgi:hypothetical protein
MKQKYRPWLFFKNLIKSQNLHICWFLQLNNKFINIF